MAWRNLAVNGECMYEQIRWVLSMFLAVLTSNLIASFVRGLTLQLAIEAAMRVRHTYRS